MLHIGGQHTNSTECDSKTNIQRVFRAPKVWESAI